MSLSIQTNVASLVAQNSVRVNKDFQSSTIQRLSSGYRINSSADDAAGLAVANKYRGDTAELTQGVQNANNGVAALQIIDGGLNNVSNILDRLRTLATQSASATFTGDRGTLNTEYQGLLTEINRQASNIKLNTGGTYNTNLITYIGGGSNVANAQVSVDLSGSTHAVDSTALGIATSSIAGGGSKIAGNTVRLDNSATAFLAGSATQVFTFHLNTGTGNQDITTTLTGTAGGLSGSTVIDNLNTSLQAYGITASVASDGTLQFGGATAFTVSAAAASGGNGVTAAGTTVNSANYNITSGSGAFVAFTGAATESFVIQNAGGTTTINLTAANASNLDQTLTTINTALTGSGITAVKSTAGTDITLQSTNSFSVNETAYNVGSDTGAVFGSTGAKAVTAASNSASSSGNALAALTSLQTAVASLGVVQGKVGGGVNKLNYAANLAQSQITNYSAAQAGIRDADVASEAANLTKAQVLQQASIAALAQANSAPQAVLALLRG
ncbi:MAG: flagellin [Bryobacterales bacterium]|jgi:flagellin|nr:flagellin [Bryobacterales bacterium]